MLRIRPITDADLDEVIGLWDACGLLRPWNEPRSDIALCRRTPSSELFVGSLDAPGQRSPISAAVMTGCDGHRGWLYYLAVDPALRNAGHARRMVRHAEAWLAGQGVPKVELMIRDDNETVRAFYERIGYEVEARVVMARRLGG